MSRLYHVELVLVGVPTPERNARRHWRAAAPETKAWKRAVMFAAIGRLPRKPIGLARAWFIRHGERTLDYTNLVDSMKAPEDGLVQAGILANDRPENYVGGHPTFAQVKAPRDRQRIVIRVQEADPRCSGCLGASVAHTCEDLFAA